MNDVPRQKLIEMVTHRQAVTDRFGRDVVSDAKLCGALLRDLCGEHKREISVLVAAVEERVPNDLQSSQANTPLDVLLARLIRRLVDDRALAEDAARWAVESWALALGLELPQPAATSKPVLATAPATPTSKPLLSFASNAPYVFECTWQVEVLGRPAGNAQAEWKKIGETPDHVTVPAGYEIGLCPHGVGGAALAIWISELQNPAAIQWLNLGEHQVNDAGLAPLNVFTNLTRLDIANVDKITDEGMAHLRAFLRLTHLRVSGSRYARLSATRITSRGLFHLRNLTTLAHLDLHGTNIADDGLEYIKSFINLSDLDLCYTPITGGNLVRLMELPA